MAPGTQTSSSSDFSTWLSVLLLGFVHQAEEWQPLVDYIESLGAFARVQSLQETYSMVGNYLAGVTDRESDQWRALDQFASRDGIFLAVLQKGGILATQEAGDTSLHADDRPLTSELEESDPQAYLATAVELMQITSHHVPEVARQFYWHLAYPLLERQTAEKHAKELQDTFEGGFVIAQSESWGELDRDTAMALVDTGIKNVIAERGTRDTAALIRDPEYRIRNTALGLVGGSHFPELIGYLEEQPSYQRAVGVGNFVIEGALATMRCRQRKALKSSLTLAWHFGVALGLLDLLGEVPAAVPQRL